MHPWVEFVIIYVVTFAIGSWLWFCYLAGPCR